MKLGRIGVLTLLCGAIGGGLLIERADAQTAPAAPGTAPAAPTAPQVPGAPVLIEEDASGHYFEWGLTAIGAGAATFAVCRSSRRN